MRGSSTTPVLPFLESAMQRNHDLNVSNLTKDNHMIILAAISAHAQFSVDCRPEHASPIFLDIANLARCHTADGHMASYMLVYAAPATSCPRKQFKTQVSEAVLPMLLPTLLMLICPSQPTQSLFLLSSALSPRQTVSEPGSPARAISLTAR